MTGSPTPLLGVTEWLRVGERGRTEQLLDDLRALGVRHLRTQFSWADWYTANGTGWYDWLLPRLASQVEVLPCFTYTPPSLGVVPKTSSPPQDPKSYADFLDLIITRLGDHFQWVELWNEPNNLNDWDWRLDPGWEIFIDMMGKAAHWARRRGRKTVLGGMCPTDPNWLDLLCRRGVLEHIDAVGIHGFPGTWEFHDRSWADIAAEVRAVLDRHGLRPELWITEAGYSTWRHDEFTQLAHLAELAEAPVERAYWYAAHDLHGEESHQDGFHEDERHYHFGLRHADGRPKLAYRVWAAGGLDGVRDLVALGRAHGVNLSRTPAARRGDGGDTVLITGGAGFVGTNLAARLLDAGRRVLILDNLSRPGVEHNLHWLRQTFADRLQVEVADVRDPHLVREAVAEAGQVYHFAAQVAVTTSLDDPLLDFEINLRGTLNLLEAARRCRRPPSLVFTSTNKVYGALEDLDVRAAASRYQPADPALAAQGIGEGRPLDFHSPYGCSKGAADQYVLDYARSYGLPAVALRMSCIYGPHQFGTEDQGWVAHFLIRALADAPITLYGDGRQVRDLLFIDDLLEALLLAQAHMDRLRGQALNIGGGPSNAVSLLEVLSLIESIHGRRPAVEFAPWRLGDQRYYVSDCRAFAAATGWSATVPVAEGVARLYHWLRASHPSLINPEAATPWPVPTR
ncbi:MAG: NAD-dependent epimerase/dehydratase family protein [Pseudomonadota bacterium]|nr:NAD-dependent epimerase/dehydratase family protein [Pseudomonadota bacterium]